MNYRQRAGETEVEGDGSASEQEVAVSDNERANLR